MQEISDLGALCEYIKKHITTDLLDPVLRYELLFYGGNDASNIPYDKLKDELNAITLKKYNLALGDQIEAQIIDLSNNIDEYINLYNDILQDDRSRSTLFNLLLYRLTYAGKYIAKAYCPNTIQYFDGELAHYRNKCVYVDCGGFDGATAVEFSLSCPDYKHIYVYEPIKKFYDQCNDTISRLGIKNITIKNAAVYDENVSLNFEENIPGSSRVDEKGNIQVKAVVLDDDIPERVDFIKMDIEGSEQKALQGATGHIKNDFPMMAICVYHAAEDLWKIPKMIKQLRCDYTFYLRHHTLSANETVLYAVPDNIRRNEFSGDDYYKSFKYLLAAKRKETEQFVSSAAYLMEQYEQLKEWNHELEDAKAYFLGQIQNYKSNIEAKEKTIKELQNWIKKLEEGKSYLEGQLKNYQEDNKKQSEIIEELRDWAKELEEGKQYIEKQNDIEKVENNRLRNQLVQAEEELGNMSNKASKLQYKYNQLINDPIIKRIMKFKRYDQ